MVDCLASTGMDPFVPLMIAALLVLAGIGAAIVAWRRGHAGAALMIGLVLIVAPLSFGAPQSASAADCSSSSQGDGAPAAAPAQSTETEPECTPATAVADVEIDGGNWEYENGIWNLPLPSGGTSEAYRAYMTAMAAIFEVDPAAAPVGYVLVAHDRDGAELARITLTQEDFGGTGNGGGFDDALFDRLSANGYPNDMVMGYTFGYSDGCGGTLDTTIAAKGLVPLF